MCVIPRCDSFDSSPRYKLYEESVSYVLSASHLILLRILLQSHFIDEETGNDWVIKLGFRASLGVCLAVKNSPTNARDPGLNPDLRRSHIMQRNKARAPQLPSPGPRACAPYQKKLRQQEACTSQQRVPLATSGESQHAAIKTQHGQKYIICQ